MWGSQAKLACPPAVLICACGVSDFYPSLLGGACTAVQAPGTPVLACRAAIDFCACGIPAQHKPRWICFNTGLVSPDPLQRAQAGPAPLALCCQPTLFSYISRAHSALTQPMRAAHSSPLMRAPPIHAQMAQTVAGSSSRQSAGPGAGLHL